MDEQLLQEWNRSQLQMGANGERRCSMKVLSTMEIGKPASTDTCRMRC